MAINSLSAASYGLSGLVSGINSQEMVEKMLSGTQAKIDKAGQKKTTLQYKQTMYRDVIAKLKNLQSSFLSFTSSTNLLSNSFYNTMNATLKTGTNVSAAFSVSASSSAAVGTSTMQYIKQLASARTDKTQVDASGDVSGVLSQDAASKLLESYTGSNASMTIKVGGKSVTIAEAALEFGGKSQTEVVDYLNNLFQTSGIDIAAQARFTNNKLEIIADNEDDFITITSGGAASNNSMGTKMFGNVTTISGKGTLSSAIDTDNYLPSFDVNLDGRQVAIRLDLGALKRYAQGGPATIQDPNDANEPLSLEKNIQNELKRIFGSGVKMTADTDSGGNVSFKFESGTASQKFTITGGIGAMGMLGLKSGISNKLNTTMALKDLNFGVELQGDKHTFAINGVQFSYSSGASLGTIIKDVNNSKAGVKISYVESEDRFVIQSSETGAGTDAFEISQSEGNLMSVLFGEKASMNATGQGVNVEMKGLSMNASAIATGGVYTFNVNGADYKFSMPYEHGVTTPYTLDTFAAAMNDAFASSFGIMADGQQAIEFKLNADNSFSIVANNKDMVVKTAKYNKDTNMNLLGFTDGASTLATNGSTTLDQAGIKFGTGGSISINLDVDGNGSYDDGGDINLSITAAELNGNLTMDGLAALINQKLEAVPAANRPTVEYDTKTAAFRVMGVDIPMEIVLDGGTGGENLDNLFGSSRLSVGETPKADGGGAFMQNIDEGKNAIFKLNGSEIQRASNTFTIDGLTYTLNSTTHKNQEAPVDGEYEQATQIAVTRDTEKIVEGITEFLKLYNETIDYINELYRADATYKDYAPLTSKQMGEMSEREIEQWEEKAKEGLLRNDQGLDRILQSLRSAMYTKPSGSSIAIYDLGISTSFYSSDGNFNASSIDDLRAAIEADPEALRQLFAGEGGIMELVNDAITKATKSSYADPGYLVQTAGSSSLDTTSSLYKQIKEVDEQLTSLETRYWSEYNRYWKQFNSMEQLIQQMNNQTSQLTQMLGG